ncbi:MAG: hypothetical protein Q4G07_08280, partial [Oscillospiraceae bacterium]|nr:hypothetical protein [Oscillospiraceae bacterium]
MIRVKKQKKIFKAVMVTILSLIVCGILALGGLMLYGKYQMSKIPDLTFYECLQYTTKNDPNAMITVGYIKDGEVTCKVFGENGKDLSNEEAH